METKISVIGQYHGQPVLEAQLENSQGVRVNIMSFGGIVRDWQVPTESGLRRVVLGFSNYEAYLNDTAHIGAIVGRVANRISGARFSIASQTYTLQPNVGTDLLHGGTLGLGRRNWRMELDNRNGILLIYRSPAGEMGFPGTVEIVARYSLSEFKLRLEITATVSETTPLNLVQHQYFNLMGSGTVLDHIVQIKGDKYTPLNEKLLPTGDIISVADTRFDFRQGRNLRDSQGEPAPYDVNFCLSVENQKSEAVAKVTAPDQSLTLKLWTNQPGLQLYTSEHLNSTDVGLSGERYTKYAGFCLEDQMFPDALTHSHFPSILVAPESPYKHWCEIEIK